MIAHIGNFSQNKVDDLAHEITQLPIESDPEKNCTRNRLFRNKRFMIDEVFQQNASKFAIFLEYKNPHSFFHFSFRATLLFP